MTSPKLIERLKGIESYPIFWLIWIAGFIYVASLLYGGVETPEFDELSLDAEGGDLVLALETVINVYDAAIEPISSFMDEWLFVALVIGILAAVCVAMRAPQSITIGTSAFIALIMSSIELYSPDKVKKAITGTRAGMICLKHETKSIHLMNEMNSRYVDEYIQRMTEVSIDFSEYAISLENEIERYSAHQSYLINFYKSNEVQIQSALNREIIDKENLLNELKLSKSGLHDFSIFAGAYIDKVEKNKGMASRIDLFYLRLNDLDRRIDAWNDLFGSAKKAHDQLETEVDRYFKVKVKSETLMPKLVERKKDVELIALRKESTLKYLYSWEGNISSQYSLISSTAQKLHLDLIKKLDKSEVSPQSFFAAIQTAQGVFNNFEGIDTGEPLFLIDDLEPRQTVNEYEVQINEGVTFGDIEAMLSARIEMFEYWEKDNSKQLNRIKEEVNFWTLIKDNITSRLSKSNSSVSNMSDKFVFEYERKTSITESNLQVIKGTEALQKSVDFEKIKSNIAACGNIKA